MRKTVKTKAAPPGAKKKRERGVLKVAERFASLRPAYEVMKRVSAVPTRFIQFDHASGVGGLPIERFMLMHGPSSQGKTSFGVGLLGSFLARGHFAFMLDAERTTPLDYVAALIGEELARSPTFLASRPGTYEDAVRQVREFALGVKAAREAGEVPEDTSALILVDSIRKLVPKGIFDKITGEAKAKGIDGVGGRAAQLKAAMNAAWMDELVPMLDETRTAMLVIARETEDPEADVWEKRAGRDYKVGGGKAIYYDASLVLRIERDRYVTEKVSREEYDQGVRGHVFGERHRVTIRKTKVAGREERETICYFHTSNGVLVPPGFDTARDVLDLAKSFGLVRGAGSWLQWGKVKWQGETAAVRKLTATPEMLADLERAVRGAFAAKAPTEVDADGVVIGGEGEGE